MNKTQPEKLNQEEKLRKQINSHYERLGFADLMKKDGVTEICINEEGIIFYEQSSIWHKKECPNNHSDTLISGLGTLLINHLKQNQKFDKNNPMLSQTMPDGERVQLVIPPAAEHASLTVRIPSKQVFSMEQYADFGLFEQIEQISSISDEDKELKELLNQKKFRLFLEKAVDYRKNILVSGATGSGKTTFMKTLISLIDPNERIITIEDARELFIDHKNKVHLVYPKNKKDENEKVTAKSCLEATLRMKPDRIILAEVRGDEAFYFIRACSNGHSGSMTSCHADSALMAYEQLALMVSASKDVAGLSYGVIKHLIMMTIDISIHFANIKGKRFITGIDFEPERKLKFLRGEKLD